MYCLVIGADRLGYTPEYLCRKFGVNEVIHWNGRKRCSDKKTHIPKDTKQIIVLPDFVKHSLVNIIKRKARKAGIPIEFIRGKSWLERTA